MILRFLRYYAGSLRAYRMSRTDLQTLQMKRLALLLRGAYRDIPYYHDLLRKGRKVPSEFRSLRDLKELPVITRQEVIEKETRMVSDNAAGVHVRGSSGTSGVYMRVKFDEGFRDLILALQARRLTECGVRPWHRLVSIWPPKKYWKRNLEARAKGLPLTWADELGPMAGLARFSTRVSFMQAAQDDPESDTRELGRIRPDFAMGRASHFVRMAEFLPGGERRLSIKGIECRHETFTTSAAKKIEEAYGGRIYKSYGSNELGAAASECRFQTGMHLNEDWIVFEVLRGGEQVGPGEQGEIVATVLGNHVMPLIRYATGDTVELADGDSCACGSSMLRVKRFLGRKEDWLRGADGSAISPLDVAEAVEEKVGISDYQIVQTKVAEFEVKVKDPLGDEERLSGPLGQCLSRTVGATVSLRFVERPKDDSWLKNRSVVRSQG